jgi:hypothetical protein
MTKKYRVFISSTLDDLKTERRELAKLIAGLGHIPVSLEDFEDGDRDHLRFIRKNIEESDYFVALTAYKYGSPEGKSARPEAEYTYAVKKGVPVIALVIDEKARWKASKKDKEEGAVKALERFKRKLAAHPRAFWTNTADLRQKALDILIREMNLNPRTGWVPASRAVEAAVANEFARLSRENEDLKIRLRLQSGGAMGEIREQMKKALKILALNKISLSFYYHPGETWENTRGFRYLRLFKLLVPELSPGKTTAEISRFLGKILNPDLERAVRKDYPVPSNTIKKIMADFTILKLVRAPGSGGRGSWEVSEYGKELYTVYRMRQLERALVKTTAAESPE